MRRNKMKPVSKVIGEWKKISYTNIYIYILQPTEREA